MGAIERMASPEPDEIGSPFMPKLIIYLTGRPNIYGYKRKEFLWSETHKVYVHEGREYTPEEFNAIFEKVQSRFLHDFPKARVLIEAPKESLDLAKEITVEEAVAILAEKQPDYLSRKAPKPEPVAVIS